jgi:hypothetical protein
MRFVSIHDVVLHLVVRTHFVGESEFYVLAPVVLMDVTNSMNIA